MTYTKAGRRALPYPQHRRPVDGPSSEQERQRITEEAQGLIPVDHPPAKGDVVTEIMREVNDTPPWAYTYRERPDDIIEIRASELQAILEAHIG